MYDRSIAMWTQHFVNYIILSGAASSKTPEKNDSNSDAAGVDNDDNNSLVAKHEGHNSNEKYKPVDEKTSDESVDSNQRKNRSSVIGAVVAGAAITTASENSKIHDTNDRENKGL